MYGEEELRQDLEKLPPNKFEELAKPIWIQRIPSRILGAKIIEK